MKASDMVTDPADEGGICFGSAILASKIILDLPITD